MTITPAPAPVAASTQLPVATALRRVFAKGYGLAELRADLLAGSVVGVVALPLSMALAIAVGAPPQHGLYTAVVAGAVTAILGGCKFQVTGPTAAFIVILAPILQHHGLPGLLTAGMMAGVMLIVMGATRMGNLIRFIPYPVTTGFTTGIAVVIATLQLKDVLGLDIAAMPEHYHEKLLALWAARWTASPAEFVVAAVTLWLLLWLPKVIQRLPAPLLALGGVSLVAAALHWLVPAFDVATIGSRFHSTIDGVVIDGIPRTLPVPSLPWAGLELTFDQFSALLQAAFAIAMLGAIESLLSAVIADGLTGTRHDPNAELVGLGVGNLLAPLFGGIAATGALARTATNIRSGARSPIAAVVHALVVLLSIALFAPLVAYVPMASLAALLLLVAWNMSEVKHFVRLFRTAPRADVLVLVTCFGLTVFFDMVWAVSVGFMLAAVMFMRRMAEITESRLVLDTSPGERERTGLPPGVALYEVNGPLFFGAAQKAMEALHAAAGDTFHTLVLHLGHTPVIDATGMAALEGTLRTLVQRGKRVVLAGPLPQPAEIWASARAQGHIEGIRLAADLDEALRLVGAQPPSEAQAPPSEASDPSTATPAG